MIQPDVSFARTPFRVAVPDSRGYEQRIGLRNRHLTLTGRTSCERFYNAKRRHSTGPQARDAGGAMGEV